MKQPLTLALYIYQGQTFDDRLALTNADGTPVDLTGYSARMQARTDVADATPVLDWSSVDGEIVIDGPGGALSFNVSADATFALPTDNEPCAWVYDLRIYNAASPPYAERVVQGILNVSPAVTRDV